MPVPFYISIEISRRIKQMRRPKIVGRRAERRVQLQEPVSFLMVSRVVEQGKWRRLKTMKARAVHRVHPAARRAGPRAPEAAAEGRAPTAP